MVDIWNTWNAFNLGQDYAKVHNYIKKYMNQERLYGRLNDSGLEKAKQEIQSMLESAATAPPEAFAGR